MKHKTTWTILLSLLVPIACSSALAQDINGKDPAVEKQLLADKAEIARLKQEKAAVEKADAAKLAALKNAYVEEMTALGTPVVSKTKALKNSAAGKKLATAPNHVNLVKQTARLDDSIATSDQSKSKNSTKHGGTTGLGFDWPKTTDVVADQKESNGQSNAAGQVGNGGKVALDQNTVADNGAAGVFKNVPQLDGTVAPITLDGGQSANDDPAMVLLVGEIQNLNGKSGNRVATSVSNLADRYVAAGLPAKAELVYEEALAAFEKTSGLDNLAALSLINNLGAFYYQHRRFYEAEHMYRMSFRGFEKLYEPDHKYVSDALHNLVTVLVKERRNSDAEEICKHIVDAREQKLGRDNLTVAGAEYELATVYMSERKYKDAEQMLKHVLAMRWSLLGSSHPDVLTASNLYEKLLHETNRSDEADMLDARAIASQQKVQFN